MSHYMESVKLKHDYQSLKSKYYEKFPHLGGAGTGKVREADEGDTLRDPDDDIYPVNPIIEKDKQIANLEKELEEKENQLREIGAVKEKLC